MSNKSYTRALAAHALLASLVFLFVLNAALGVFALANGIKVAIESIEKESKEIQSYE